MTLPFKFILKELVPGTDLRPGLRKNDVAVFFSKLDLPDEVIGSLRDLLTPDEIARAAKFHFEKNKRQYVVTRGTLRRLLSAQLDLPARSIALQFGAHGKPYLEKACGIEFNVSHTHNLFAIAITEGRRVGVDVEAITTGFRTDEIAERFFSENEREALRALPEKQRFRAFFQCWTLKESYIKAFGEGLTHPLDRFDVRFDGAMAGGSRLIETRPDFDEAGRWWLQAFDTYPGFAAGLAVELHGGRSRSD